MTELAVSLTDVYGKGLSYSSIKYAYQDMTLFEMYMKGQLKKDSDALRFGSLYDCMLFTPELVDSRFSFFDDSTIIASIDAKSPRATSKYKEWLASFEKEASASGKIVVSEDDHKSAMEMISRLQDTGVVDTFLSGSYQEEFTGFIDDIPVRGFLDCLGTSSISDSKTVKPSGMSGFKYDVNSYGYDIQAYMYTTFFGMQDFYWVCQEKNFPYNIGVYKASEFTIKRGKDKFDKAISNIKDNVLNHKKPQTYFSYGEI